MQWGRSKTFLFLKGGRLIPSAALPPEAGDSTAGFQALLPDLDFSRFQDFSRPNPADCDVFSFLCMLIPQKLNAELISL